MNKPDEIPSENSGFLFGSDLSYVNQILDHGGVYQDSGAIEDPYEIFSEYGNDLVRLRLWHNPSWTLDVYDGGGTQMYNDLLDVERAIRSSRDYGMQVLLDFHYSDRWADPGTQNIPEAWLNIRELEVLADSMYNYTFQTLTYLDERGLMPEFVQIGNETNCGMFFSNAPDGFPSCEVCNDQDWENLRTVVNSAVNAVNEVKQESQVDTKIILHVADPVNVDWWFGNLMDNGALDNFDIIGFSYYPSWHTGIPVSQLEETVEGFIDSFGKQVMILETAYAWTTEGDDSYNNIFGPNDVVSGYDFSPDGQFEMMTDITQNLKDGGGMGIIYWEPAWISSDLRDLWGTGSSWENNTFFDYEGRVNQAIEYMSFNYE